MALTANASVKSKGEGDIVALAVDASSHVYRNAIVGLSTAGYAKGTATAGSVIRAGIAREEQDNSSGSAGDLDVEVYTAGEFLLTKDATGANFAQGDVGDIVYASADNGITKTATSNMTLGYVTKFVSTTQVWVKLLPFGVLS